MPLLLLPLAVAAGGETPGVAGPYALPPLLLLLFVLVVLRAPAAEAAAAEADEAEASSPRSLVWIFGRPIAAHSALHRWRSKNAL